MPFDSTRSEIMYLVKSTYFQQLYQFVFVSRVYAIIGKSCFYGTYILFHGELCENTIWCHVACIRNTRNAPFGAGWWLEYVSAHPFQWAGARMRLCAVRTNRRTHVIRAARHPLFHPHGNDLISCYQATTHLSFN